jgi:hypothetical protein
MIEEVKDHPDEQGVAEPLKCPKGLRDLLFSFICPRLIPKGSLWEKSGLFI